MPTLNPEVTIPNQIVIQQVADSFPDPRLRENRGKLISEFFEA